MLLLIYEFLILLCLRRDALNFFKDFFWLSIIEYFQIKEQILALDFLGDPRFLPWPGKFLVTRKVLGIFLNYTRLAFFHILHDF